MIDLTTESEKRLREQNPQSVDDVRTASVPAIAYSETAAAESRALKKYLHQHLYNHHRVLRSTVKAQGVLQEIFTIYTEKPQLLPPELVLSAKTYGLHRAVADYLAGMTDRYAIDEHERLFNPRRL